MTDPGAIGAFVFGGMAVLFFLTCLLLYWVRR